MAAPIVVFETAQSVFAFVRRVCGIYNTYKQVVDAGDAIDDYNIVDSSTPKYHVGEDTYLFILGISICKQAKVNQLMSADDIAWEVLAVISQMHDLAFVRHPDRVVSYFLYDLGRKLTTKNRAVQELLLNYRKGLKSPVKIEDPFVTQMNSTSSSFTMVEANILSILSGRHTMDEILELCKIASRVPRMGYAPDPLGHPTVSSISRQYEQQKKPLHKTMLGVNFMLLGANEIINSRPRRVTLLEGPVEITLFAPVIDPSPAIQLSTLLDLPSFAIITPDMIKQMNSILTTYAGYVQTGDRSKASSFADRRNVVGRRDGTNELVFVMEAEEDVKGGESTVSALKDAVKAAVKTKATSMAKTFLKGRRFSTPVTAAPKKK